MGCQGRRGGERHIKEGAEDLKLAVEEIAHAVAHFWWHGWRSTSTDGGNEWAISNCLR